MGRKKRRRERGGAGPAGSPAGELRGIARLLSETPADVLDLHGLTGAQARSRLEDFLRTRAALHPGRVVHVVTGRGTGSDGPPVLPAVAREVVGAPDLAHLVGEQAGLPGGGGLAVRLR